jgi:hypothetical protein
MRRSLAFENGNIIATPTVNAYLHKQQIPPLRYAPVGMTSFLSISEGLRFISNGLRFAMGSLGSGETQGVVVFLEFAAEGFDDEVVVVALGQAGDGD